jgi:hypothetical protein
MNIPVEQMKAAYDKHKNLKVAADELGMKWQTLYWCLKKYNHPVVGNKSKYGTSLQKINWLPYQRHTLQILFLKLPI